MNTTLPDVLHIALVEQYNAERMNSVVYKAIQSAFEEVNWTGFAHWCGKSAAEEIEHSEKIFKYLTERQAFVAVSELPAPPEFDGEAVQANFEAALALEVENTAKLAHLTRLALDLNDFMTVVFMDWFNTEQKDSEAEIVQIISDLKHGNCDAARIIIDRELGGK